MEIVGSGSQQAEQQEEKCCAVFSINLGFTIVTILMVLYTVNLVLHIVLDFNPYLGTKDEKKKLYYRLVDILNLPIIYADYLMIKWVLNDHSTTRRMIPRALKILLFITVIDVISKTFI